MKRDQAIEAVQTLHAFLRDSRPTWTHELPSREGFYWLRSKPDHHTMVVEVRLDYSEKDTPGHPADTGVQYLRDYDGCLWAGPIEQPQG